MFPDRTAVAHGDRRYTYREFEDRVDRLVRALKSAGLEPGDRVAFLSPNTPAMLEAHYAVPAAAGVLVAINTRLNSEEVGYILEHSGVRFLYVDAELQPTIEPLDLSGITVVRIDDSGAPGDPYVNRPAMTTRGAPTCVQRSWVSPPRDVTASRTLSGRTSSRPAHLLPPCGDLRIKRIKRLQPSHNHRTAHVHRNSKPHSPGAKHIGNPRQLRNKFWRNDPGAGIDVVD